MKVVVLANQRAGSFGQDQVDSIRRALTAAGIEAEVRPLPGNQLANAARSAVQSGVDAVIAAGGDGTISAVAGVLADSRTPLGVLPVGTLNHFAKDLRLPLDLHAAARVIAGGHIQAVDLGDVNGRTFVNNSSIGIYPEIVKDRDEQRLRLGRGKWLAMGLAGLRAFRRFPLLRIRVEAAGASLVRRTPFVFVGNNKYEISLLALGARSCLDRGELSLYLSNRSTRIGIVTLSLRAMFGRLDQAKDFDALCLAELRVEARKRRLAVSLDGEVAHLAPPLHYRTRPGALKVFVPIE